MLAVHVELNHLADCLEKLESAIEEGRPLDILDEIRRCVEVDVYTHIMWVSNISNCITRKRFFGDIVCREAISVSRHYIHAISDLSYNYYNTHDVSIPAQIKALLHDFANVNAMTRDEKDEIMHDFDKCVDADDFRALVDWLFYYAG